MTEEIKEVGLTSDALDAVYGLVRQAAAEGMEGHKEAKTIAFTTAYLNGAIWSFTLREGAGSILSEAMVNEVIGFTDYLASKGGIFLTAQQLYVVDSAYDEDGEVLKLTGLSQVSRNVSVAPAPKADAPDNPPWADPSEYAPSSGGSISLGDGEFIVGKAEHMVTSKGKDKWMLHNSPGQPLCGSKFGVTCWPEKIAELPENVRGALISIKVGSEKTDLDYLRIVARTVKKEGSPYPDHVDRLRVA